MMVSLLGSRSGQTLESAMSNLQVHFVNRGYKTDYGIKEVKLVELGICEFTQTPEAKIESPYWPGDTLRARYEGTGWVCDLD